MSELAPETTTLLTFEGALEPHEWERLRQSIIDAAGPDVTAVVLDLSQVTFFDSHSIRALLGARRVLEPRGVTIHLGPCSHIVQMVVDITGIGRVFPPLPG
jgi:anti-anti-sigma factor